MQRQSFSSEFPNGLPVNGTIAINGEFAEDVSGSIVIGIQDLLSPAKTVLLEIKIDFAQKKVFRSYFQNGTWGAQEDYGPFPFAAGEPFDLSIHVTQNSFVINVDYKPVWSFYLHAPLTEAKYVVAEGALDIDGIVLIGKFKWFFRLYSRMITFVAFQNLTSVKIVKQKPWRKSTTEKYTTISLASQ